MNRRILGYELGFDKINKLIVEGFTSEFGPGDFPIDNRLAKLKGVIAPNYSYETSNAGFAWSYKEIAESEVQDVYVILGRGGVGRFSTFLFSDWETPLGLVRLDTDFGKEVIRNFPSLKNSFEAFEGNNSIDVQLPLLQFANRNYLDKLRFVPFLVGDVKYEDICAFADAISDTDKRVCVICSSNFMMYGKKFDNVPFVHSIKQNVGIVDNNLLDFVSNLDTKGFLEYAKKSSILDRNVIAVFMEIMKGFGSKKGRILYHYTSGDIEGYENAVGFGSVAF